MMSSRRLGAVASVALLACVGFGISLSRRPNSTESAIQQSIFDAFSTARPTGGRLLGIPYAQRASYEQPSDALKDAELSLVPLPHTPETTLLRAYFDIAYGRWRRAASQLELL